MTDVASAPPGDAAQRQRPRLRGAERAARVDPRQHRLRHARWASSDRPHHASEPETSLTTALLLLTDRRWRDGAARLVRRIADSSILDADQLDLLARTFIAAADAIYLAVPDEWLAGGEQIVIDLDGDDPEETDGARYASGRGPRAWSCPTTCVSGRLGTGESPRTARPIDVCSDRGDDIQSLQPA